MALSQGSTFKIDKPTNVSSFLNVGGAADVSNFSQFSVQVYCEGVVAPLTGYVEVLASNIGGAIGKYAVLTKIPIDIAGTASFFAHVGHGEAAVKELLFNYVAGGAGVGTIKTITVFGKQN